MNLRSPSKVTIFYNYDLFKFIFTRSQAKIHIDLDSIWSKYYY